ncbi:MAG: NADH-quinone oxidoreductase subunit NuoG [Solirubrobacterales bacterium]
MSFERPRIKRGGDEITLVVDGVEVAAPEGAMLVDAAKQGDVEIPVFCYEPKLGDPVGACRMCLVEIEGVPKLQTACSTPVRDGMVVYTATDRVKTAQEAVVEFLLVNHPLDCPVCDKGGECPLQDVSMGWGPQKSRFTDPKRHFQKPIPLSPLVKIDRERCILCYRCVRFSQEVSEDEQLQLLERGDRSFVGTFDNRPYVAPFHGNIVELCPVGALTSQAYRFRARPWEIEDAGSICTLCPSQCNVLFTVRDERVERVMSRDNLDVDDGWLCDKGRFGYQMISSPDRITEPMVRRGGELRETSWSEAIAAAADGLGAARGSVAALIGGGASNEEGYLVQRIVREALGSADVVSGPGRTLARAQWLELARPELAAAMSDLDAADAILVVDTDPMHSMPILDLRIRKAVRRAGARLAVASARPTALDGGAAEVARYAPGDGAAFLADLAAALGDGAVGAAPGAYREDADRLASALDDAERVVVVWGGPLAQDRGAEQLLAVSGALGLAQADDSGLIEVPRETNARGLREVGCVPNAGPGYGEASDGRDAAGIRAGLESDAVEAAILVNADPVRDYPDSGDWGKALGAADFVVSAAMFEDASTARADVVFPAESHAEKEGTVTHPDGRLQRLRPVIPRPGGVRMEWEVLVDLSAALGDELGLDSGSMVLERIASEVPFYAGITHEEIGGTGVRWQERDAAAKLPEPGRAPVAPQPAAPPKADGRLRLGTYRDLWAGEITERNPALRFLVPNQTLELAPPDAERLGVAHGEQAEVRSNGASVRARVAVRARMRPGAGFLIEGTKEENANRLAGADEIEVSPAE